MSQPGPPPRFRLSVRDLIILVFSVLGGVGTGVLLATAGVALGQAVVAAAAAFAGTLYFLDRIIDDQRPM